MKGVVVAAAKAAWAFLRSPEATRAEIVIAIGVWEAIRDAIL